MKLNNQQRIALAHRRKAAAAIAERRNGIGDSSENIEKRRRKIEKLGENDVARNS